MTDIEGIYIINNSGELIFQQENVDENSKSFDPNYLSNFFATLETIAHKIGEDEVRIMDLGENKFFLTKDKITNIEFILKCNKNVKSKKVFQALTNIVNIFIQIFTGNFNSPEKIKERLMTNFIEEIKEVIGESAYINYNLDFFKPG